MASAGASAGEQAGGQEPEELTVFVQNLLAQMVRPACRRASVQLGAGAWVSPRGEWLSFALSLTPSFLHTLPATTAALQQSRFQAMSDAIITKIDEMGTRIDDLEKSISDLMVSAGAGAGSAGASAATAAPAQGGAGGASTK